VNREMTPEERALWASWPSEEEQRASHARDEQRRLRRALEEHTREMRRGRERRETEAPPPPVWESITRAYRATGKARPSQVDVAEKLDRSESTLRRWLRGLGMRWTDVHARMNAAK
jgi:hypothetical protein